MSTRRWITLSKRTWTDNWQRNDYEEILKIGTKKVRLRLHHDYSYEKQCWTRAELWSGTKWEKLGGVGRGSFKMIGKSTDFRATRDKLLAFAEQIIF